MSSNRTRRAMEIFDQLCDLPTEQVGAALERACGSDIALRGEVEALLRNDHQTEQGDDTADALVAVFGGKAQAGDGVDALVNAFGGGLHAVPDRIGAYHIVRKIGEGGMGEVFEAEQDAPRRRVALKVIRAGHLSPTLVRRFEHEAFVLGQLQHPGIAHIYESAMGDVGGRQQPYFAMELIQGERINTFAANNGLSFRQRLELMARVCDAVQHAHQRGIIHRDLKPANILVAALGTGSDIRTDGTGSATLADEIGQPKILDFGIARITDGDVQAATLQTDVGQLVGTLAYMSPEQVAGDSSKLDTRCDVYALGVVLFQLLTDRLPLEIGGHSVAEAARIIRDEEPTTAGSIDRTLRGEVDTILAKALEKDPERRYASAAEFAADLRRYLASEPILARPPSAVYQARKFASRHRALVGGIAATFVALIVGLASTTYYLREASQQRDEAEKQRTLAEDRQRVAEQQRDDLQAMQDWYADLLREVDVAELGDALVSDLRDRVQAGMEVASVAEIEAQLASLDQLVAYANATDFAIDALDLTIFDRAEESIDRQFAGRADLRANLLTTVAKAYEDRSRGERALALLAQAEAALAEAEEPDGDLLADILRTRGYVYDIMDDRVNAVAAQRISLAHNEEYYGRDHEETIRAMGHLAVVLYDDDRVEEAGDLVADALQRRGEKAGMRDAVTLNLRATQAAILSNQSNHAEAFAMASATAEAREEMLGPEHEATLGAWSDAGFYALRAGKNEESEAILRDIVARSERVLGDDHVSTNSRRQRLASLLQRMGQYDDSLALLDRVQAYRERVYGPDHVQTQLVSRSKAIIRSTQKRYAEAEALYRACLPAIEASFGRDHRNTTKMLSELARVLMNLGKLDEAEQILLDVRQRNIDKNGEDHQLSIMFAELIAMCRAGRGELDAALALQQAELERAVRAHGETNIRALILKRDMVHVLQMAGRAAEAEPYSRAFLAAARERNAKAAVAESLIELGSILLTRDERAEARQALEEVLESVAGAESIGAARAKLFLGLLDAREDRFAEAEPVMLAAYNYLKDNEANIAMPRRAFTLGQAAGYVAELYERWGKPEEAAVWRARANPGSAD